MSEQPRNHQEIIALIKRISGQANFIGTPRIYIDMFNGDLVAAVWFNQVVYWDGKTDNPIGFYKTYAEWKKELGLSRSQVSRVAKECERLGLVNISFHKVYGTPKNHYLVIWPELLNTLQNTLNKPDSQESDMSESDNSEGEESEGSKEGEETSSSLSIEETTPKSDIDNSIKDSLMEIISSIAWSVFGNDMTTWWMVRRRLEQDCIHISGDQNQRPNPDQPMKIVVSGLSERKGHFSEADIWEGRFYRSFANLGLEITFTE